MAYHNSSSLAILVNASSAKYGGAREILYLFVNSMNNQDLDITVICPNIDEFKQLENIKFIEKQTSGIMTLLFSIFGVIKYIKATKPNKVISFTNVSTLFFPWIKKYNYLHQLHVLQPISYREWIYRFFLKCGVLFNHVLVCQSPDFAKKLSYLYPKSEIIISWPGCRVVQTDKYEGVRDSQYTTLLVPLSTHAEYKNLQSVIKLDSFFKEKNIEVLVTGGNKEYISGPFHYLGKVTRTKMSKLYCMADCIVFPSMSESYGLPVVEFLATGKTVFLLRRPYNKDLFDKFIPLKNLKLYDESPQQNILDWIESGKPICSKRHDLSIGNWSWVTDSIK